MTVTITTNGTGAGVLYGTLPSTPARNSLSFAIGRENSVTGNLIFGYNNTSDSRLTMVNASNNTYPAASGYSITIQFWYFTA
jgi:hypothetical protein